MRQRVSGLPTSPTDALSELYLLSGTPNVPRASAKGWKTALPSTVWSSRPHCIVVCRHECDRELTGG